MLFGFWNLCSDDPFLVSNFCPKLTWFSYFDEKVVIYKFYYFRSRASPWRRPNRLPDATPQLVQGSCSGNARRLPGPTRRSVWRSGSPIWRKWLSKQRCHDRKYRVRIWFSLYRKPTSWSQWPENKQRRKRRKFVRWNHQTCDWLVRPHSQRSQ